jgi:hypothetical protein
MAGAGLDFPKRFFRGIVGYALSHEFRADCATTGSLGKSRIVDFSSIKD